jgi:uncharacterized protein Smg (DUF494 family)
MTPPLDPHAKEPSMNDEERHDAVQRLLQLMGDRLESYLEGDDLAFETLGEAIEEAHFTSDEMHAALLVLNSLSGSYPGASLASVEGTPGKHAQRVWSDEERESLTPEAWGFLLDLKRRGSLDPEQFERVLDVLTTSMTRPVGIDVVREVAARIALHVEPAEGMGDSEYGDHDLAH